MNINYTKFVVLRSNTAGVIPTIPTVANHKTAGWIAATDIYEGELFLNTADKVLYTRAGNEIVTIGENEVPALTDLTDVAIAGSPGPTDGDILTYNSGVWSNGRTFDGVLNVDETARSVYQEGCTASGNNSFAEGYETEVTGDYSHAEGSHTAASGKYAHAEGSQSIASGYYSHAEGSTTTASGNSAHAEGSHTAASGNTTHAEGFRTTASGGYAHAEGSRTTASGNTAHAEGSWTTASGYYSHAEGSYTTASGYYSHSQGYYTYAIGDYSDASGVETFAGPALRSAAYVDSTTKLTFTGVDYSAYFSAGNTLEFYDLADKWKLDTTATVTSSTYVGGNTEVVISALGTNYSALAVINITKAANYTGQHTEGELNNAVGTNSHAEGKGNTALGTASHVEGEDNKSTGAYSHSEGKNNISSGSYAHAEGFNSIASGQSSNAKGDTAIASRTNQMSHGGGKITAAGDAQFCRLVLKLQTTDDTPTNFPAFVTETNHIYSYRVLAVAVDFDGNVATFGGNNTVGDTGACGYFKNIGGTVSSSNGQFYAKDDGDGTDAAFPGVKSININVTSNEVLFEVTGAATLINWVITLEWTETIIPS